MRINPRLRHSSLQKYFFGLLGIVVMSVGFAGNAAAQLVTTPSGAFPAETYNGTSANGVSIFRGIRYAAAPVGNRRFAPPVPPAAVSGTLDATQFGSACPQVASPFGVASTSEDCLFLNVYVPGTVSSSKRLPVMLWIHGGGFISGAGSIYDPTQMVLQGNVIVVTINYRLGFFGALATPALSATSGNGVSGNYNVLDQQLALKWVQQNIGAFGGDRNNVTVFGESAGGFSVCSQLVMPSSGGLFDRAISESGPCAFPFPTLATLEAIGTQVTQASGCANANNATSAACLRSLSTQQVLALQGSPAQVLSNPAGLASFFPNVDGKVIPQQPEIAIALGQFNRVPVIQGTNQDEGRLFIALAFDLLRGSPLTAAEYPAQVQAGAQVIADGLASTLGAPTSPTVVQQLTQQILNQYPLRNFNSPDEALAQVLTDGTFSCPALVADELFSIYTPTFAYEFADLNAPMLFLPPVSFPYRATHTDELQYLFTNLAGPSRLNSDQTRLATVMKGYWTNFAKNGSPNAFADGFPHWDNFTILGPDIISFVPPTPQPTFTFSQRHSCNFWTNLLIQGTVATVIHANGG